jgi:hypothetical protein
LQLLDELEEDEDDELLLEEELDDEHDEDDEDELEQHFRHFLLPHISTRVYVRDRVVFSLMLGFGEVIRWVDTVKCILMLTHQICPTTVWVGENPC